MVFVQRLPDDRVESGCVQEQAHCSSTSEIKHDFYMSCHDLRVKQEVSEVNSAKSLREGNNKTLVMTAEFILSLKT